MVHQGTAPSHCPWEISLRNGPSQSPAGPALADAQVASKATIWALNGLRWLKKCLFNFHLCHKSAVKHLCLARRGPAI